MHLQAENVEFKDVGEVSGSESFDMQMSIQLTLAFSQVILPGTNDFSYL
jgi:hypothetical protein